MFYRRVLGYQHLTPLIVKEASKYFLPEFTPPSGNMESWQEARTATIGLIADDHGHRTLDGEPILLDATPESTDEFVAKYRSFFSELYVDRLQQTFFDFDALVGFPVSDGFISNQYYSVWTESMVTGVYSICHTRVVEGTGPVRSTVYWLKHKVRRPRGTFNQLKRALKSPRSMFDRLKKRLKDPEVSDLGSFGGQSSGSRLFEIDLSVTDS
jgi:hypothetical protein